MSKNILILNDIKKSFQQGDKILEVLTGVDLVIKESEVVSLIGPSGCGKSTLLQIIGLIDNFDSGKIVINDINCTKITDNSRTLIRRKNIGFVYQSHHLLQEFTVLENVMFSQILNGKNFAEAKNNAIEVLEYLSIADKINSKPSQLSGGQQQRAAIARAVINKPKLLLADEPTGNLDPASAANVFNLLIQSAKKFNISVLLVTHNEELAKKTDRILILEDGKTVQEKKSSLRTSLRKKSKF